MQPCSLPDEVRLDMENFIDQFSVTDLELNNMHIRGVKASDIVQVLKTTYLSIPDMLRR